jgi:hypothetical protein
LHTNFLKLGLLLQQVKAFDNPIIEIKNSHGNRDKIDSSLLFGRCNRDNVDSRLLYSKFNLPKITK